PSYAIVNWDQRDILKNVKGEIRISDCKTGLPDSGGALWKVEEGTSWYYEKKGRKVMEIRLDHENKNKIRFLFNINIYSLKANIHDIKDSIKFLEIQANNSTPPRDRQIPNMLETKREQLSELEADLRVVESLLNSSYSIVLVEKIGDKTFPIARFGSFSA